MYDFGGIINIQSLSCELIEDNNYYFLCIINLEHKLEMKIINCTKNKCVISANKDDLSNYYDGIIYNTLEMNVKFFCAKVNEQTKIDCSKIETEHNSGIVVNSFHSLSSKYTPNNYDINNCNFIYFLSGYLFCCSCKDYIICNKFTYKFDKETEFTITFDGENSFLTLINNIDYLSILFLNRNNMYRKNIYSPNCTSISSDINHEIEININKLFDIKNDSNYYLKFCDFESSLLKIELNGDNIGKSQEINLNDEPNLDELNFKFILKKDNLQVNNLNIKYSISIEKIYSSSCLIKLIINHNDNSIKTQNIIVKDSTYNLPANDLLYYKCDYNCIICIEENKFNCISSDNNEDNSCLNICPQNYRINYEENKCVFEIISLSEFKNELEKNITSFVNSTNIINGSDFIAMVYPLDDINQKEQLEKGISSIDFGECTKIIKNYYNISQNESLIVLNIELKQNKIQKNDNSFDLKKDIYIEIYDFSGRKLNLSICQENIKVMKYIGDIEELDIQTAKDLATQGIDVFNAKDKFFNDLCYYYNNKDNKDIIIDDRRKDIFQNISFCQGGCIYDSVDYDLMSANCICKSNFLINDNSNNIDKEEQNDKEIINFDSITKSFISNLFDFNFNVLKCFNLVVNLEILKRNFGFYFMVIMFLLQVIFLIIYLINGLKNIKRYMILFQYKYNKNNLLKTCQKNFHNCKYKKQKYNIDKIYNKPKQKNKLNKKMVHYNISNPINRRNKILNNKKNFIKLKKKSINNNIDELSENSNLNISKIINKKNKKKNKIYHMKTNIKIDSNNNKFNKQNLKNNLFEDLENINYEKAIIYDKRNYCRIFFSFLVDSQIILGTFCTDNYLYLFIIKLSFFVYTIQISFFLNSLFYTDEYISDAYYNNGVLNFISGLPKSIYSSIVSLITTNLLRILSNNKKELKQLIIKKRNYNNYRILVKLKLNQLKYKLISYFIIVFILGLFFSYYVTSFCAVYRYSQKYLFLGFIESFIFDFIISIISSMFLSLLRYISIKKKIKCLFMTYKIISIFI